MIACAAVGNVSTAPLSSRRRIPASELRTGGAAGADGATGAVGGTDGLSDGAGVGVPAWIVAGCGGG